MLAVLAALCLTASPPAELRYDLRVDLPVTAALGGWWLVSEYALKKQLAPKECRWCGGNPLDDAWRAVRSPSSRLATASTVSDVIGIALTPVAVIGADALLTWSAGGTWQNTAVDALIIIEAMTASQALNQTVKFLTGRERPFVAQVEPSEKPLIHHPEDNNLSFFSGHTAYVFSLVAAGAMVAHARGYSKWWVILAVGLPLAAGTAMLRTVADKHYLSDVIVGASVGSLIGFTLPALFHRPINVGPVEANLSVSPGGVSMVGAW